VPSSRPGDAAGPIDYTESILRFPVPVHPYAGAMPCSGLDAAPRFEEEPVLDPGTAPLRSDARRNRDLIVTAATAHFLEHGPDAPLDAVARAAGVGIGTLYRRFPTRDALLGAVLEQLLDDVVMDVRAARDSAATPWDGLMQATSWSRSIRTILRVARGPVVTRLTTSDTFAPLRDALAEMLTIIDGLVRAAQADGTMRTDVSAGDIVLVTSAVSRSLPHDGDAAANAYSRAHAILAAGLRANGATPLPGHPVGLADLPL
jgi:AcrR family transcriptional regulator